MHSFIGISSGNVKKFIYHWNSNFIVDHWWRSKHNISFNSLAHQQSCFIDQAIEYLEEREFKNVLSDKKKIKYEPGKQNYLIPKKYTEKEIDKMFNELDLDSI